MNTTEVILALKLEPEWYSSLSTVLGFETFEDYVSDCIETSVRIYIAGGDDIDENIRDLVYESEEQQVKGKDQRLAMTKSRSAE